MPHRSRTPVKKEPRLKKEEFEKEFGKGQSLRNQEQPLIASIDSLQGIVKSNIVTATDSPKSEELAETIEVQFTPDIIAKAEELENNPVQIYNWVRNNIDFVPSYGSIQGAQMTLETNQGNAFDIASLLVALFRVSGIHARYAIGTIELPIEQLMNWGGGFTDPIAASEFFASGGIPTKILKSGGIIEKVQMEHVWVEAYIDYIPSRGAIHKQGDTWISLDASFKQYNYTEGVDIQSAVPFDAEDFINQIEASATINKTEGYVTGLDSLLIELNLNNYRSQIESVLTQNYSNATVGDIIGNKKIINQEFFYFPGTLPYRASVIGWTYADIPDVLRHKITFEIEEDAVDEEAQLNFSISIPELAGKKITLSYSPATTQDENVINSYCPESHTDTLPESLPAYLINVRPELKIDSQIVALGTTVKLGKNETFSIQFYTPYASEAPIINNINAGEYISIGLNLGKISGKQLDELKDKMETLKTKLKAQDYVGLEKDNIPGDLFYAVILSYFIELESVNFIEAKLMGIKAITLPSEMIFGSKAKIDTLFGTPLAIGFESIFMDVDKLLYNIKALDGDNDKAIQFMINSGIKSSALEHEVPEQLFAIPDNPLEGISAVKALKIANDQGIPVYTITQSNIATIMPQLQIDSSTKSDIKNAINTGKIVLISKSNINFNNWVGCGYIIINPNTGSGAYMISGGLSGSNNLFKSSMILLTICLAFYFSFWGGVLVTVIITMLDALLLQKFIFK